MSSVWQRVSTCDRAPHLVTARGSPGFVARPGGHVTTCGQADSKRTQRWVLGLTSVASLMVALDTLVVSTALSTIRVHLSASIEALEWTVNAYSLSFAVLLMTAAVLGGAVTQGLAWPWIFWLNIPIGVLLVPLALRRMPESFGAPSKPDIGGLALVTAGAFGVVWGLVRANTAGWASVEVVAALMAG